ncbi:MAG: metal ABC transporter substrate-binding protein [Luteolibacter sp.]
MFRLLLITCIFGLISASAAELTVAVLHPLLGDIARQVGGSHVQVIDLIGPNGDPHHFEPKPEDIKQAEAARIYLIAGMGLESYLPKLKAIISNKANLIDVGASLPALEGASDHEERETATGHELDPHWWHSIDLFRRATSTVADAFAAAAPENAELFQKNATTYRSQLDELERWSKREIAKIPRDKRQLATAHAAFNYFCKDFGFIAHPVQGLNREQMPDPKQLARLIDQLKTSHVVAIFPEKESNPKILQTLTHDTGIRLAEPLIADGVGVTGYDAMYRHNVETIVKALAPPPGP